MINNFYDFINEGVIKYTDEELQDEVNKYESRSDLKNNDPNTYSIIVRRKLLDELFKNHPNNGYSENIKPRYYWSKENLQEEADKYETRDDFRRNNYNAYQTAIKQKILDELFNYHINQGYLDKEEWKENSYVIYVYELEDFNMAYVGLTNDVIRRNKEHLLEEKRKINIFCKENNIPYPKYKILEENLKSTEAQRQEKYWINFYKDIGWEMFNIAKAGGLGSVSKIWTKKALQEEANKYETRREFQKNNLNAYSQAVSKRLLDELFKNHSNNGYSENQKISGYWTKERLQDEVNKYETRDEFKRNSVGAHTSSLRQKLLDELFKNHSNDGYTEKAVRRGYWTKERIQDKANKYEFRRDFAEFQPKAYDAALNKKILDEIFKNHPNKGYTNKMK